MDRMALATVPLADADDAELLASRLSGLLAGIQGHAAALQLGLDQGRPGAGVLAERLIGMLRASARSDGGYFGGLAAKAAALPGVDTRTVRYLEEAGRAADGAYDQLADWLEDEYLPRAAHDPAVGPERYARALQDHLGIGADPLELAAWGWEELDRLERELRQEAAAGWPGVPLAEVLDRLDHNPGEPSAAGPAELLDWLGRLDRQVARRLGEEFDIPPQLRVLRHELAPPARPLAPTTCPRPRTAPDRGSSSGPCRPAGAAVALADLLPPRGHARPPPGAGWGTVPAGAAVPVPDRPG
jgi:uncharacterized protein (DUF885 family)